MPDDRRSLMLRLSFMQYFVAAAVCGARDQLLDLSDRALRKVQGDGAGEPPPAAAAAGAAGGAARPQRRRPGPEPEHVQYRARPRADQEPRADPPRPGARDRGGRSADARDREPPAARSELPADRAHRERDARAGDCRHGPAGSSCPASFIRKCPRAGIRPARWRRTCSAMSARSPKRSSSRPTTRASSPGRSSGRPASSRPTTGG